MKSKNSKLRRSLVAVASAARFSAALLAGCAAGNGGLPSTPTSVEPNATAPFSAFAGPEVKPDAYNAYCAKRLFLWAPDGREYFPYLRSVKIYATTIPSEPGVSYQCIYDGQYGLEFRTTKLSPKEFVKRLLEPKVWYKSFGPESLTCEALAFDCGFIIEKKN